MATHDKSHPTPAELAELSALADGTLDPARREQVEARLNASPVLRERLREERAVVEVLHAARARDRAPEQLRNRIEELRSGAARRPRPRPQTGWPSWPAGAMGALAAVVVALVLLLPGGSPGGPSVAQAARLALAGPSAAAPATNPAAPYLLSARMGGLSFPRWRTEGLTVTGQRRDRIAGHSVLTVFYRGRGGELAYSIISVPALRTPDGAAVRVGAYRFRTLVLSGRMAVTWREDGQTCILSATGVPFSELERLAAGVA